MDPVRKEQNRSVGGRQPGLPVGSKIKGEGEAPKNEGVEQGMVGDKIA